MDGQRKPCPIVKNQLIELRIGGNEVILSAACDSIQMFPDPNFTHLRIFSNGIMRALFMDEEVMADLADMGIPITIRESITEAEHESWITHMGQLALAQMDAEIDQLLDGE